MSALDHVAPTRMELLARRAQLALARQGRDLLQEKRNALWKELLKTMDLVLRESGELERAAGAARRALAQAEAVEGREAVESAAFAAHRGVAVEVTTASVMGVTVPSIQRPPLARATIDRGYSLATTSAWVDEAAARYEEQLEMVIDLAAGELRLRRLADEIRKTTVRVNALETVVLPRLAADCARIECVLEEREREDLFRLKRVKAGRRPL